MTINPLKFYASQLKFVLSNIKDIKKRLLYLSLLRLFIFVVIILLIYFFSNSGLVLSVGLGLSTVVFLLVLSSYTNHKGRQLFLNNKKDILEKEIQFIEKGQVDFEDGSEFKNGDHPYSSDIDLYGKGSFFQYINRTVIFEAKQLLSSILGGNDISNINEKQAAIQDLMADPEWRLNFSAKSTLIQQNISHSAIFNWLKNYKPIVPRYLYLFSFVLKTLSTVFLALYVMGVMGYYPLLIVFFLGLLTTSFFISKINKTNIHLSELKDTFGHYSDLIAHIECKEFTSQYCQENKAGIKSDQVAASELMKQFSKHLSALDQRNNILFAVLGNGLLLWDCTQVYKIEKWIFNHKLNVQNWFETIVWFDAQNSLANYAYNNSDYVFPIIKDEPRLLIKAEGLGHFMLNRKKRVDNDFKIDKESFTVVTGANMAGKSTFLRTVSSSIVSANTGLPVCAKSFEYHPIKLITSMRNTDSLQDDSSYFFAELSRLKVIVEAIKSEPYFIILDEILKGTNSKDKEKGSIQLLEKLSKTNSSGLIATHDLGLCEIEKSLPNISNQYFDADIIDNELYFDYTLKNGICQNMNASFLLKKMEII